MTEPLPAAYAAGYAKNQTGPLPSHSTASSNRSTIIMIQGVELLPRGRHGEYEVGVLYHLDVKRKVFAAHEFQASSLTKMWKRPIAYREHAL